MFKVLSDRKIGIYFFIDFKKAFDLVPSDLLLFKLKNFYGFDENANNLLKDYFTNRSQFVKVDSILSNLLEVLLGVPQGSVLGPLLFILFINDMPFFLQLFLTILFADDTSLSLTNDKYDTLISNFNIAVEQLIKWCYYNKFDINWKKSEIMFITNKRSIQLPEYITIENQQVKVVSEFKLLGVIIDSKLNFVKNTCKIRKAINTRLYSIQKLFHLPLSVKIQFIKTFILPYFDYCQTLCIYFSKEIIQKLANTYNNCLFKLLNTKAICNFSILTSENQFIFKYDLNKKYSLRNENDLYIPSIGIYNQNGTKQFIYFFSKFINEIMTLDKINFNFKVFKSETNNNIINLFLKFIKIFVSFDLKFKPMYIKHKT